MIFFGSLFFINLYSRISTPKQYYIDFIGKTEIINQTDKSLNRISNSSTNKEFVDKMKMEKKTVDKEDKTKQLYKKQIEDRDYIYTNSKNLRPSMIDERSEILENISKGSKGSYKNIEENNTSTSLISFDSDFPYPYYITKLRSRLYDSWQSREVVLSNLKAVIRFNIMKDGSIKGVRVYTSSGNKMFDEAAILSVHEIGKFDPLPDGFDEQYLSVYVEFKSVD